MQHTKRKVVSMQDLTPMRSQLAGFDFSHRSHQGCRRLFMKEDAGQSVNHGFQCAPPCIRNHGRTCRHGLHENDTEIFDARKNQPA